MNLKFSLAVASIAAALSSSVGPATADTVTASAYTRMTGEEVASLLKSMGYKAELSDDESGDPRISSATGGAKFYVYFYGCTKDRPKNCASLQLYAGFAMTKKPTYDDINRWNRDKRFATAYLDKDGDPNINSDIVLTGGISAENFKDRIAKWENVMSAFQKHINF